MGVVGSAPEGEGGGGRGEELVNLNEDDICTVVFYSVISNSVRLDYHTSTTYKKRHHFSVGIRSYS